MPKFLPTKRTNDCPVCGDISGKCRTKNDAGQTFTLCMTNSDAKLFDIIDGWKCIKVGSKGWATFTADTAQPQIDHEERQQRRAQREKDEKAIYQAGLSPQARHEAYTAIFSQLGLDAVDEAEIERRGMFNGMFDLRSIEPWQELDEPVSELTPGCNGSKLLTKHSGYLVPAFNIERQIIGCQIRNRAAGANDPKYPWLSTQSRPVNMQNGELPITYAPGEGGTVNLCEGILKPMVAAERLGSKFIGAAGGNFASSPEQLKEYLAKLSPESIVLCPDGGATSNRQVMRQYSLVAELVKGLGYAFRVRWWGQETKTVGDVDEISREQFEQAQLLTWSEFKAKDKSQPVRIASDKPVKKVALKPVQIVKATDKKIAAIADWRQRRDAATYSAIAEDYPSCADWEVIIKVGEDGYRARAKSYFYERCGRALNNMPGTVGTGFAQRMTRAEGRTLHAYDISKGTGKSTAAIIPEALDTVAGGERALIFVPTRSLASQLASRINKVAGDRVALTHQENGFGHAQICVTCPESAFKFKAKSYDFVAIDEVNEVSERIQSGQLGNAPKQSFNEFGRLLRVARRVTVATDDLWRVSLDSIKRLGKFADNEVEIQRKVRPVTEMQVLRYDDFKVWLSNIVSEIKAGKKISIPCGAQGKGRVIDRILRAEFPGKTGYCIDGKDTNSLLRKEFFGNPELGTGPDDFIAARQPDWLIFTPVANSGVSLETNYFDAQYEYITPSEGATNASQRGERNRSAIGREGGLNQRHIFFSQFGSPSIEAFGANLCPETWTETLDESRHAPIKTAVTFAKKIGVDGAIAQLKNETSSYLLERVELPKFLAMKAFDIIFREERLLQEWTGYGWEVGQGELTNIDDLVSVEGRYDQTQIDIAMKRARILNLARTREDESELGEIDNPLQAARIQKKQLENLLGKDVVSKLTPESYAAWSVVKSREGLGLSSLQRRQLMSLALENGEVFQAILDFKAMKLLAGKPDREKGEHWYLPEMPASSADIDIVAIFSKCPGLKDILTGKLTKWTNYTQAIVEAAKFLTRHAKLIAANTRRISTTGTGYKFSERMKPAETVQKALEILGHHTDKRRAGKGKRYNVHTLLSDEQRTAKAQAKLANLIEASKGAWRIFKAKLDLRRAQEAQGLGKAIKAQMMRKIAELGQHVSDFEEAQAAIQARHTLSINNPIQKPCDEPVINIIPGLNPNQNSLIDPDILHRRAG